MDAFHSNWTRPFTAKHPNTPYFIEDFELLTTVLSALKWREKNGGIQMITDFVGANYYKSLGIDGIWNLGISTTLETAIPSAINELAFWAAGKLFALRGTTAPCVMLDTDFIVWDSLHEHIGHASLAVIHREALSPDIYPSQEGFHTGTDYWSDKSYDWTVLPCNTALTYIKDQNFLYFYTNCSIDFMENAPLADNPLTYMVFAEQRLISMCAKQYGIAIHSLSEIPTLFSRQQSSFTHIWGYKQHLRDHPDEREVFCRRCLRRIHTDFPQTEKLIRKIPQLQQYY